MRIFAVLLALVFMVIPADADFADPQSTVRLIVLRDGKLRGYGSGTYIGNKQIITAAHVIGFNKNQAPVFYDIKIGWKMRTVQASVVWADSDRDVAVIEIEEDLNLVPIPISCDVIPVGTEVRADGYPLRLGKVATWGRVSSTPRPFGMWEHIYVVTMPTIVMGQSGAGVSDQEGKLRGILVGIPGMEGPGGEGHSFLLGLGFVVSGPSICAAMERQKEGGVGVNAEYEQQHHPK